MRPDLELAEQRALAMIGVTEIRPLGELRPSEAVAFARAAAETDPRYLHADRDDFAVHPMYLPSMLRGPDGGVDEEYRSDGMFADEVPGTEGLDVRLMAGGQSIDFVSDPQVGDTVSVQRQLVSVTRKGRSGSEFLLLQMAKEYTASESRTLTTVRESFIVR